MTNGMQYTNLNGDGGGRLYFVNPVTIQENVIDLGAAGSAQYQFAGAAVNTIPREGGNQWSGTVFSAYTNHSLQSDNLSDDLKAKGLTVVNGVRFDRRPERPHRRSDRQGQVVVRDVRARQREHAAGGEPVSRRQRRPRSLESRLLGLHAGHRPARRSGGAEPELFRSARRFSFGPGTSLARRPISSVTSEIRRSGSSTRVSRASSRTPRCATTTR